MNDRHLQVTPIDVEQWIITRIAEFLNVGPETISRDIHFDSHGIDSARAIALMFDLEEWLELPDELPLELLFEAESVREAAENIVAAVRALECERQSSGERG